MTPSPTQSSIAPCSIVSLQPSKNTSSTATSRTTTSLRHDSFFKRPNADAVVLSSDHVLFRCFAWDLQEACSRLKFDQLPQTAKGVKKLQLAVTSAVATAFLALVTSHPVMVLPAVLSFEELCSLLDLSTQHGFEKGVKACLDLMSVQAKEDPWKVFELASKRDDVQLALKELQAMEHGGEERMRDLAALKYGGFKDIAPAYTFDLLRLLYIHKSTPIHTDPFTAASARLARPGLPDRFSAQACADPDPFDGCS